MSDQDGTPSLEGFLPVQETPKETPPVTEVPETPAVTEGTPAQPDPQSEQPVVTEQPTVAGKTPEQLDKDRAYFQTEAQKAKEELKRIRDEFQPGTAQPTPSVEQTVATKQVDRFQSMSQEELENWIAAHPVEAMMAANEKAKHDILTALEQREAKKESELAFKLEQREANRFLNEFSQRNKITQDEFNSAKEYINTLGVKGSPTVIAEMVTDRLIMQRLLTNTAAQVETVKANVAQQVKQQLLTVQPGAGTTPAPKQLTPDEIVASKFRPSKEDKALAGFFGGPN